MRNEMDCSCSDICPDRSSGIGSNEGRATARAEAPLCRSIFRVPGMDCPSEEQMIRLRLSDAPIEAMDFDLVGRTVVIDHTGDAARILERLEPLGYGATLHESRALPAGEAAIPAPDDAKEAKVLWALLGVNALMFVIEIVAGWWARSAGLIADAADMLADAAVYGVALYAVGRDAAHKLSAARISGLLQLALAVGAIGETGRRVISNSSAEETVMIGISLLALAANVLCLVLISRHRHRGVHMRASYIFSANDVLANLGVILAGVLVARTGSSLPDWIIGFIIGIMVLIGAVRILRLR